MTRLIAIILTVLCASVISIAAYPSFGRHMPPSEPDDFYEIARQATWKKDEETIPKLASSNEPRVNTKIEVKFVNDLRQTKSSEVTPTTEIIQPRPMFK